MSEPWVVRIDDVADPRLEPYTRLTDVALRQRKDTATGTYVAESSLVVRRAFEAGHRIESFLLAPRWLDALRDVLEAAQSPGRPVPVYVGEAPVLAELTGFHLHRGALALVLGTEGAGLSADAVRGADVVVRIPMSGGVDSLNVAAAAAVAFWATRPAG